MYFSSVFRLAFKRLLAQRGLTLATTLGLVIAVALAMSVPLYADTILHRMLTDRLETEDAPPGPTAPFSLLFQQMADHRGAAQWAELEAVDSYFTTGAAERDLGLPLRLNVRYFKTYALDLYATAAPPTEKDKPVASASFGTLTGLERYITLVAGRMPELTPGVIEVLVSERQAQDKGLQAGRTFLAFYHDYLKPDQPDLQLPVYIAGIWRATNAEDIYWFFDPAFFNEVLFMPENAFFQTLPLEGQRWISEWYLVPEAGSVRSDGVPTVMEHIRRVQQNAQGLLDTVTPRYLPLDLLTEYQQASRRLTFSLFVFSMPIVGLLIAFINLVVGLSVERQRNEIAMLRSRGASWGQVVGIGGVEGLGMCALALAVGLPLSEQLTRAMSHTRSFMNFTLPGEISFRFTLPALIFGLVTLGLVVLVRLIPTSEAARQTIVTYRQERAREARPVWWQRWWLDVGLLLLAIYGFYVLRRPGGLAAATQMNPFTNPFLILVPALGILAVSLFLLRFLPKILALVAWAAARTSSVSLVLAARHLARAPAFYGAPLVLLILTLSLATFTATLASTLDNHLLAQQRYQTGGDLFLKEIGECLRTKPAPGATYGSLPPCDTSASLAEGPIWQFPPLSDHLKVPGVTAVTRVARWGAEAAVSGQRVKGIFLGIDPAQFGQVAYWRSDYASVGLAPLLRQVTPEGVLVSRDFLTANQLAVGDTLEVYVNPGRYYQITRKITGVFDYFPTWYAPTDGAAFVADLDSVFQEIGGEYPYNVWAATAPNIVDFKPTVDALRLVNIFPAIKIEKWVASPQKITAQQGLPDRQGVFGVLSVGFVASALLTVLGFFLYALFSFRKRFIEIGITRAIGLSTRQMTFYLAWEQAFLIGIGLLVGTGLGILVSGLFIPTLQFGTDVAALVPPFRVQIAWGALAPVYFLFGVLFVGALGGLVGLLRRMKIFQAVKLGETV